MPFFVMPPNTRYHPQIFSLNEYFYLKFRPRSLIASETKYQVQKYISYASALTIHPFTVATALLLRNDSNIQEKKKKKKEETKSVQELISLAI